MGGQRAAANDFNRRGSQEKQDRDDGRGERRGSGANESHHNGRGANSYKDSHEGTSSRREN